MAWLGRLWEIGGSRPSPYVTRWRHDGRWIEPPSVQQIEVARLVPNGIDRHADFQVVLDAYG
jgi:hypothetical protein